jgi:hypothetical protein
VICLPFPLSFPTLFPTPIPKELVLEAEAVRLWVLMLVFEPAWICFLSMITRAIIKDAAVISNKRGMMNGYPISSATEKKDQLEVLHECN